MGLAAPWHVRSSWIRDRTLCLLHWQADCLLLSHQGSPKLLLLSERLGWVALSLNEAFPGRVCYDGPPWELLVYPERRGSLSWGRQDRWGLCELRTSACVRWSVFILLVISWECGLTYARFPEFSREAGNILISKSWQLIKIFDKYCLSQTKYVFGLNLAYLLFMCMLCYI